MISLHGNTLSIDNHYSGWSNFCKIVSPARKSQGVSGNLSVRVSAYDVSAATTTVEYSLDDSAWKRMIKIGKFSWQAEEERPQAGAHHLAARVRFEPGARVE